MASSKASNYCSKDPLNLFNLDALPDVPLRILLSKLPLSQLIHNIPLVSPRLSAIVPSVLTAKRHLVLHIGDPDEECDGAIFDLPYQEQLPETCACARLLPNFNFDTNRLKLTSLNEIKVRRLTTLLANIKALDLTLIYVDHPETTFQFVGHLLKYWSLSLKTLKMHCQFKRDPSPSSIRDFIAHWINPLPVLEHLTLDIAHYLGLPNQSPFQLSILGRLKQFYFNSEDELPLLYYSLDMYAEGNEQLEAIGLANTSTFAQFLTHFQYSNLAQKFVLLPGRRLDELSDNKSIIHFLATFTRLIYFRIPDLLECPFGWLFQTLAPLTCLVYLSWNLEEGALLKDPPANLDLSLPSVKVLSLELDTFGIAESSVTLAFPWGQLFPSVQIIALNHFDGEAKPDDKMHLIRQLLSPLLQCQTLEKVYYRDYSQDQIIELKREDI